MTWTATAQGTGAPTPTLGTPVFLDPFGTPLPTGTPGVNLTCPDEVFDTSALEYEWARVCSACVEAVHGTPTPPYGMAVGAFPTLNLSTFTPIPTGTQIPTSTPTPTATATFTPTGTLSPTPSPTPEPFSDSLNFRLYDYVASTWAFNGTWSSGTGFLQGTTLTYDGATNGYRLARYIDLGYYIRITSFSGTIFAPGNGKTWRAYGFTTLQGVNGAPSSTNQVTLFNTAGTISGESTQTIGGNYLNPPTNGYYIRYILFETHGFQTGGGWAAMSFSGYKQYIAPTPTPTPTVTPTVTPTGTVVPPTSTPNWWATSFPQYAGVSVDCREPRYIDLNQPLVDWHIGPSEHETVCLTVLPQLYIGFDLINNTIGQVFGFELEAIDFKQVNVCFVGISVTINFLGFQLDMSILLGVPILAMLLRWVLFQ